jgi:hypothetical protein
LREIKGLKREKGTIVDRADRKPFVDARSLFAVTCGRLFSAPAQADGAR